MVVIKSVSAKSILDSRKEKTISVSITTNLKGSKFSTSAPTGKSTGKHEAKPYKKSLEKDIETLKKFSDYFSEDVIEKFGDLRRIEDIVDGHVGANTLFALQACVLKALAKENKKQVWEMINKKPAGKLRFPRLVGNCVGGGEHSKGIDDRKPDFQEFLLIPNTRDVKKAFEINKKTRQKVGETLKRKEKDFSFGLTDENAWLTSLNDKEVLDFIKNFKEGGIGIDAAASTFYKRKKYHYKNPRLIRTADEQFAYVSNLIKNEGIFYVEDPFDQEDFQSFAKLTKAFPDRLIVGDDLTTTNPKRFEKAIKAKAINGIIVKPNQVGSLISVRKVCEMAREKNVKIVFSHRSGETREDVLADLAFGFQADFFKCGIVGPEREAKIKRMISIQKSFGK